MSTAQNVIYYKCNNIIHSFLNGLKNEKFPLNIRKKTKIPAFTTAISHNSGCSSNLTRKRNIFKF
jgi:hypothetical protein